jgi:hypothetical protein
MSTRKLGLLAALIGGLWQNSLLAQNVPGGSDAQTRISKASGLPLATIQRMLSDCDADQQSMNFCAWRDRVDAEDALSITTATWDKKSPACKSAVSEQVARWMHMRNRKCAVSPADGSGALAEATGCQASMTLDYAQHFAPPAICR